MFVNISNHASSKWSMKQFEAAMDLTTDGIVIDIPFPNVDPQASATEIKMMAHDIIREIEKQEKIEAVMVMGEMSLCYHITHRLKQAGFNVVVATTERKAFKRINEDGTITKQAIFDFVQFREV